MVNFDSDASGDSESLHSTISALSAGSAASFGNNNLNAAVPKYSHQNLISDLSYQIDLATNDTFLYSSSFDNTCVRWSNTTKQAIQEFKGHTKPITCHAVTTGDTLLFTGSFDNTVKMWRIFSKQPSPKETSLVKTFKIPSSPENNDDSSRVSCICLNEKDQMVFVGCMGGNLCVFDYKVCVEHHNNNILTTTIFSRLVEWQRATNI